MLVQLDRVMKKYGSFALELNMEIPENQVTGLIGANWSRILRQRIFRIFESTAAYSNHEPFLSGFSGRRVSWKM